MKIVPTTPALLLAAATAVPAAAAPVTLGDFTRLGADTDATVSFSGNTGGTVAYNANGEPRVDVGIVSSLTEAATFTQVGDKITFSGTYDSITTSASSNNAFYNGFLFNSVAAPRNGSGEVLKVNLGYGSDSAGDARFTRIGNNSAFAGGSAFAGEVIFEDDQKFATGNAVDFVYTLELTGIGAGTSASFDYQFTAEFAATATSGAASITAAVNGVGTDTVTAVYAATNNGSFFNPNDTWTLGNAAVDFTPVPEPASALLLAAGGLVMLRRRSA
ncbi:PEP-CTERM sorting domain-containing protein [Phycisphaera mikurensis]|uniref:PEP-CTERM protein-sorting domain-containing protein n=1 Tax=Phycisphaera mikurensis (strain NBRC 102666 / KCTC 22515 / FYK2301M01) TaxID=1142394 RepID=I0IHZ9_PHYMF|nr:PEP-CTERM sorting domain-containing protein [Phycisphaera mikurensis]MBB6442549.1 hypothetical protein [Phycisphaera mikurensis]BAM04887.1 hypothetical protein PSMK_27280 [Phycisphaera mikurensis NBRC 102666]